VSRGKLFPYPEESDPELWKKYVNEEKSGYMAHHGTAEPPEEESQELSQAQGVRTREGHNSETSSHTQVGEGINEGSGVRVDPEKGKDKHVIDWYGPEDPQVCFWTDREIDGYACLTQRLESTKLVATEEVLRYV
jgi:DHA1 family multidrug resistance protein-like MFS transporter